VPLRTKTADVHSGELGRENVPVGGMGVDMLGKVEITISLVDTAV
jgi:hypothetical protein